MSLCCLNPQCSQPNNLDRYKKCQSCDTPLRLLGSQYKITDLIGHGGFGRTYRAEDTRKLNELRVVKQFAPLFQNSGSYDKGLQLFKEEAKKLKQLGKENFAA